MKNAFTPVFLFVLATTLLLFSCQKDADPIIDPNPNIPQYNFSTDAHNILKNGEVFPVKGVVYVPFYPGYIPWEIENSVDLPLEIKGRITQDLKDIKAMGANTIRLWGAPAYCYEALRNEGDLHFIQTLWIEGEAPDFQDPAFKAQTKAYFEQVIDRIYAAYPNNNPPLIAYLVGNELSESGIVSTDSNHPGITSYTGNYIRTEGTVTATEAFLAEMADHVLSYEYQHYGRRSLVSYANEIRTFDLIDTPFLDFRSQNAYSYAVAFFKPGTASGSNSGTIFQGWVEERKADYPDMPLLITETGLSVSPNAAHAGPPNYGYGGNTEQEQASGLLQNLNDIETANLPLAGACIHEYLDAWWKFSLQDSYTQDPNDIEEWFGLAKLVETDGWYHTDLRPAYQAIQAEWAD
jgi:hypothetical protein